MTDLFLKVNKDLWRLKLNANEQLILSYILEYQRNTGDCFISDQTFAEYLNTSRDTVSRILKKLEGKGYITRQTKNVKSGKERHLTVNIDKLDEDLAGNNLQNATCGITQTTSNNLQNQTCTNSKMPLVQTAKCHLYNLQNQSIKDNIKDNIKTKEEEDKVVVPEEKQEEKERECAAGGIKASSEALLTSNPANLPLFHLLFSGANLEDLIDMGLAKQIEENIYEVTTKDGKRTLCRKR